MADGQRDTATGLIEVARSLRRHWRAFALSGLVVVLIVTTVLALQSPPSAESANPADDPAAAAGSSSSSPAVPSTSQPPPVDPAAPTPGYVQAGDTSMAIVPGGGPVLGTAGPLITFDVQVEGGLGLDGIQFATYVEQILADPRGWTAGGQRTFQRTSDGQAALHIMLVSPAHVESHCPGYNTGGYTSCRNGDLVVVNLARWSTGVPDYQGYLWDYRQYLINHEVGHFVGFGHVECPGAGLRAPVMMQQTLGLNGCMHNSWPYPNSPADDPNAPA